MASYPGGKGRSGIGKVTRDFVRSFFLPHGGTEHPPGVGSPLYAGRMDGHPALFAYGSWNPIAIESRNHGENPFSPDTTAGDWPAWLVSRAESINKTAIPFREVVAGELLALGYVNTGAGWTIKNGRDTVECDIWMKTEEGE